jgi:hypothetical protein
MQDVTPVVTPALIDTHLDPGQVEGWGHRVDLIDRMKSEDMSLCHHRIGTAVLYI